jgi:hypothetical protein
MYVMLNMLCHVTKTRYVMHLGELLNAKGGNAADALCVCVCRLALQIGWIQRKR